MTTLRIEVGRYSGTTIEDVVAGLQKAGCMKDVELYTDSQAFLPIAELRVALRDAGFYVDDVTEPPPPPLPWWRYVRAWPRRVYFWGRRVFLRESMTDQLVTTLMQSYRDGDIERLATVESPFLRKLRQDGPTTVTSHAPRPVEKAPCSDCGALLNHAPDCEAYLWKERR